MSLGIKMTSQLVHLGQTVLAPNAYSGIGTQQSAIYERTKNLVASFSFGL